MTPTEIWNAAVVRCSGTPITTTGGDETVEEELFGYMYPMERDAVLSARDWSFNRKIVSLSPLVELDGIRNAPVFGIPSDTLRVWRVDVDPYFKSVDLEWEIYNNRIVVPGAGDQLYVYYGYSELDSTRYTPDFVKALVIKCATALALPLKQSVSLRESLLKEYDSVLTEAAALDGMSGSKVNYKPGKLRRARNA
jgi:hypothetical protein